MLGFVFITSIVSQQKTFSCKVLQFYFSLEDNQSKAKKVMAILEGDVCLIILSSKLRFEEHLVLYTVLQLSKVGNGFVIYPIQFPSSPLGSSSTTGALPK